MTPALWLCVALGARLDALEGEEPGGASIRARTAAADERCGTLHPEACGKLHQGERCILVRGHRARHLSYDGARWP